MTQDEIIETNRRQMFAGDGDSGMTPIDQLKSVLCDPEGKCCIAGSDEDRAIVDRALQALAQPVQEPVGYVYWCKGHAEGAINVQTLMPGTPLYTSPPQRKPLTDEEIDALANNNGTVDLVTWWRQLARAIEAALRSKNND